MTQYDYVVIGAGSAGCAVAARLSENGRYQVALIEAGAKDDDPNILVPAAFGAFFKSATDWGYYTTPQKGLGGRPDYAPRGKVIGGSSSTNAMIVQRGNPADYDRWAALGNDGWAWKDVLPFFRKLEDHERGASDAHGVGGPIASTDQHDPNPLTLAFLAACRQLGLPSNDDFNAGTQEGFGLFERTIKDGERWSAARGYLHPAANRRNLTVISDALVEKLSFEGTRCSGAVYRQKGEEHSVAAAREVVLCAGAFNSPQILMLSGIGAAKELASHGIKALHNLPGVGKNLQDHLMVPVAHSSLLPLSVAGAGEPAEIEKYQRTRRGLLASNVAEAGGFVKLNPASAAPELQFIFGIHFIIDHGFQNPPGHGFTIDPGLVAPKSTGEVSLRSADPAAAPLIDPNFLAEEEDVEVLLAGIKLSRKIFASAAFDRYRGEEKFPGNEVQTDAEIRAYIPTLAQTIFHPTSTCKMGSDPMAVVDSRLRVRGTQGLRVADASIMPFIVNANTNVPTIMTGEKCADMILNA